MSGKQLLFIGKQAAGSDGWNEDVVSVNSELSKPQPIPDLFVLDFLQAAIWGGGYGA